MKNEYIIAAGFTQDRKLGEKQVGADVFAWSGHFCEDDDDELGLHLAELNDRSEE
jgi:hypothetical protein